MRKGWPLEPLRAPAFRPESQRDVRRRLTVPAAGRPGRQLLVRSAGDAVHSVLLRRRLQVDLSGNLCWRAADSSHPSRELSRRP